MQCNPSFPPSLPLSFPPSLPPFSFSFSFPFPPSLHCPQVLRNKVDDVLVLTSHDFPAAVVKQRLGDKASIQALVEEVRAGLWLGPS